MYGIAVPCALSGKRSVGTCRAALNQMLADRDTQHLLTRQTGQRFFVCALVEYCQRSALTIPLRPTTVKSGGGATIVCETGLGDALGPSPSVPLPHRSSVDRTHERQGALRHWDALVGPHPLPRSRVAGAGRPEPRARGFQCGRSCVRSYIPVRPSTHAGEGRPEARTRGFQCSRSCVRSYILSASKRRIAGEGSSGLCQGVSIRQKVRCPIGSVPSLNLRTRERGDERPALERPDAAEGALSHRFCPPLKPEPGPL